MDTDLKTSDAAVLKATGYDWAHWFTKLDQLGAQDMNHKQIASMLSQKGLIKNAWWCQQVTVVYEKKRGLRVLGETADAGFQIGVSKTIPADSESLWKYLISSEGRKLWLGEVTNWKLVKSLQGKTEEGLTYEIRSCEPQSLIRIRWQPAELKNFTVLQIRLFKVTDGKTRLTFHHEKLSGPTQRQQMQQHWQQIAIQIADHFSKVDIS